MKREKEIALLEELMGLKNNNLFFLDPDIELSPIERYASIERFNAEMKEVFRKIPSIAAHPCELPEAGSFLTRDFFGHPLLLTRDKENNVHAFLNVCRHRGARLVGDETGCKHSFSCPYHAWTWNNNGNLRAIPHEEPGFPDIDRNQYALKRLPVQERNGLIWVVATPDSEVDFNSFLTPLDEDFAWIEMQDLAITHSDTLERPANWKLLVEGGIEAYHFKVAHRETIGPHFVDNLSSYEMLGDHMRSILPRSTLDTLQGEPRENWSIRDHANVLYSVFPVSQFLVMQDHVAWIELTPLSSDRTKIRMSTLAPKSEVTPENAAHWKRNHTITSITLAEDFDINQAVQDGLASGSNTSLTFGRYEGALNTFNRIVEKHLA